MSALMRVYSKKGHRVLSGGSIEIEGNWAATRLLSLAMSVLLIGLTLFRFRLLVLPATAFALYWLVLPPRRRILFDIERRTLCVEHAGPWREPNPRPIPFASIHEIVFERAATRQPAPDRAMVARTASGDVYLITLGEGADSDALEQRIRALALG